MKDETAGINARSTTSKLAIYPFDHPDADVILRSSDDPPVDFHVFKLLLSLASPFFELVFTLPQPLDDLREEDGLPVISMAEDERTLKLMLGFCYPVALTSPPELTSLGDLQLLLKAAVKYDMDGVQKHIRKSLMEQRFVEAQPLRVFATACRYGWLAEAKRAARYTLRQPASLPFVEELEFISAAEYHRLQEYHVRCGDEAATYVSGLTLDVEDDWVWTTCTNCEPANLGDLISRIFRRFPGYAAPRKWWVEWMNAVASELRKIPWGETVKKYDLMNEAISKAKRCIICESKAAEDLDGFSHILAVRVEKQISTVELVF